MGVQVEYYADERDRAYGDPTLVTLQSVVDAARFARTLPAGSVQSFTLDGGVVVPPEVWARIGLPATAPASMEATLARFRATLARSRSGGLSAITAWLGDSFTESYEPSKRGRRWINRLAHRLNGPLGASSLYVPAAANTFSSVVAADWPGDQAPWVYSSAPAGSVSYGADLHAVVVPTGATATLVYNGDIVAIAYTRTPGGPPAAAVTVDGVAAGTIDAEGTETPGLIYTAGTIGEYGSHTLVVTATAAPLVLEGALVHDGTRWGFGSPFDTVWTLAFGHAGFDSADFAGNANWATSLAALAGTGSLIGISLGANDLLDGRDPAEYRANLVEIMLRADAAIVAVGATTLPGYLLVHMPGVGDDYLDAAHGAAADMGTDRCGVLDLAAMLPDGGTGWGVFDAGNGHPNDGGQFWIADAIADAIDPDGPAVPQMRATGPLIEATDVPEFRSSWAESFGFSNAGGYDASPTGTGTHERRHRVWFEPGTYTPRARVIGTAAAVIMGVQVGAASAGTQSIGANDNNATEVTFSAVAVDAPGWYPVIIRKSGASTGALRFSRLYLRKTA